MKTTSILLVFSLSLSICLGEIDPDTAINTSYETFSVSRVRHIVNNSQIYSDSAIGVDDTFENARADVRSKVEGQSFAPPTSNFGYTDMLTSEDEFGITVISLRHFGRTRIASHDSDSHESDVNSVCQLLVAPFRISGNFAPISLDIKCRVSGSVLRDPEGTAGKSETSISGHHIIRQVSDSSQLSEGFGEIQHDSKLLAPDNVPRFLHDFAVDGGSSIVQGGGQYLSNTSYTKDFMAGYLGRLALFTQTVASFSSENLAASDDESWDVNHNSPVIYTLSSTDPNVRFRIYENEAPTPRPDLSIGASLTGLIGNGFYTPSAAKPQTSKINQGKRKSKMIYLDLENDGPTISGGGGNNSISFRGPEKQKKISFSYFLTDEDGTRNVTAQVIAGTFTAPAHLPGNGNSISVKTQKKKSRKKTTKKKKDIKVDFIASNSGAGGIDVSRALIRTK